MADNVFINGRAAVHAGSAGKSIAFPDVCLCPPPPPSGPIPTPLPNTAQAMDLQGGAATVTIESNPIAHAKSFIAKSTGNEVATSTGGGVITHMVQGMAYFQTFSMDVFIESQPAVRHMDLVTQNHMAMMPGNTPPAPWMATMLAGPRPAPKESEKDERKGKESITFSLQDQDGRPLPWVSYSLKHAKGTTAGRVVGNGKVVIHGLPKGQVELTLPEYDAVGWEKASPGPETGSKTTYKVRQGDTLPRIAWMKGFSDWKSIYTHSDNAVLRQKRPNPEILAPGDNVVIPPRKPPVFKLNTNKEHILKVKRPKISLHLALTDDEGAPLKNARYEIYLTEGPKDTIKGSTDGQGILKEEIPYDEVEVDVTAWPAGASDKESISWHLYVGGLDPIDTPTGVQARLQALGFNCGDEYGEIGPETEASIGEFKERHKIEEEDLLGPKTLKKLEAEYGR